MVLDEFSAASATGNLRKHYLWTIRYKANALEILLTLTYLILFLFIIHKSSFFMVEGLSANALSLIFITKCLFGTGVWAVYTYYYTYRPTADVFKYFDASEVLFKAFQTQPIHFLKMLLGFQNEGAAFYPYYDQMNYWLREVDTSLYNDNRLIIRVNTLIRFFSLGYFHIHTLFFSFFSMIGLTALYKTFAPLLRDKKMELAAILFFIPSVLFWGSGVLKEGLVWFALGLFIYSFSKPISLKRLLTGLFCLLLLGILKFYILVCLLPPLAFWWVIRLTGNTGILLKFMSVFGLLMVLGLNVNRFSNLPNALQLLSHKQNDFLQLASGQQVDAYNQPIPAAGSAITINKLEPNLISLYF